MESAPQSEMEGMDAKMKELVSSLHDLKTLAVKGKTLKMKYVIGLKVDDENKRKATAEICHKGYLPRAEMSIDEKCTLVRPSGSHQTRLDWAAWCNDVNDGAIGWIVLKRGKSQQEEVVYFGLKDSEEYLAQRLRFSLWKGIYEVRVVGKRQLKPMTEQDFFMACSGCDEVQRFGFKSGASKNSLKILEATCNRYAAVPQRQMFASFEAAMNCILETEDCVKSVTMHIRDEAALACIASHLREDVQGQEELVFMIEPYDAKQMYKKHKTQAGQLGTLKQLLKQWKIDKSTLESVVVLSVPTTFDSKKHHCFHTRAFSDMLVDAVRQLVDSIKETLLHSKQESLTVHLYLLHASLWPMVFATAFVNAVQFELLPFCKQNGHNFHIRILLDEYDVPMVPMQLGGYPFPHFLQQAKNVQVDVMADTEFSEYEQEPLRALALAGISDETIACINKGKVEIQLYADMRTLRLQDKEMYDYFMDPEMCKHWHSARGCIFSTAFDEYRFADPLPAWQSGIVYPKISKPNAKEEPSFHPETAAKFANHVWSTPFIDGHALLLVRMPLTQGSSTHPYTRIIYALLTRILPGYKLIVVASNRPTPYCEKCTQQNACPDCLQKRSPVIQDGNPFQRNPVPVRYPSIEDMGALIVSID